MPRIDHKYVDNLVQRFLSGPGSPEEKLWAAVLLRAVADLMHKRRPSCEDRFAKYKMANYCPSCLSKDNAKWWFTEAGNDYIGSFRSICEIMDCEPDNIIFFLKERELL